MPTEIAQALGAGEGEAAAVLARSALLLVIDNFEQLLDAAPELGRLLAASPRSKLVVTSRAALRIAGEHELARAAAGRRARGRAVHAPRPRARPAADARARRRRARSSRSARASTACRWRSSSPPRA